jgi:hypothetical protein
MISDARLLTPDDRRAREPRHQSKGSFAEKSQFVFLIAKDFAFTNLGLLIGTSGKTTTLRPGNLH